MGQGARQREAAGYLAGMEVPQRGHRAHGDVELAAAALAIAQGLADQAGRLGRDGHGVGRGGVRTGYIGVIAGAREGALEEQAAVSGGDERGVQARGGLRARGGAWTGSGVWVRGRGATRGARGGIAIRVHMHLRVEQEEGNAARAVLRPDGHRRFGIAICIGLHHSLPLLFLLRRTAARGVARRARLPRWPRGRLRRHPLGAPPSYPPCVSAQPRGRRAKAATRQRRGRPSADTHVFPFEGRSDKDWVQMA